MDYIPLTKERFEAKYNQRGMDNQLGYVAGVDGRERTGNCTPRKVIFTRTGDCMISLGGKKVRLYENPNPGNPAMPMIRERITRTVGRTVTITLD